MPAELSPNKAVYTGSFDPVTLGHLDIIERSARLYSSLVIGVGVNSAKQSLFSTDERIELLQRVTRHLPHVSVERFDGLAVDFVRNSGAMVMVRGVRPLTDIAAEFTMMMANRQLDADIETVFLYLWATTFKDLGWFGFGEVTVFLTILVAGYVYVVKRGALEWD